MFKIMPASVTVVLLVSLSVVTAPSAWAASSSALLSPLVLTAATETTSASTAEQGTRPAPPSASAPATLPDGTLQGWVKFDALECEKSRDRLSLPDVYIIAEQHDRLALWQETAKRGMPEGQVLLALCHGYGVGVDSDPEKKCRLLQAAIEKGNAAAMYYYADALFRGDGVTQDRDAAILQFRRAADAGDRAAMWQLGYLYANGDGMELDKAAALKWLEKSAKAGAPYAMYQLGQAYFAGDLGPANDAEGRQWIAKAADLACPFGIERLRQLGGNGTYMLPPTFVPPSDLSKSPYGTPTDTPQELVVDPTAARTEPDPVSLSDEDLQTQVKSDAAACRQCRDRTGYSKVYIQLHAPRRLPLWKEAAKREFPEGLLMVGLCYTAMVGFDRDDAKKAELFRLAAEKGNPTAMHDYAVSLTDGRSAAPDEEQAIKLWMKAAELGEPAGMWHIALIYRTGGPGVEKNADTALNWCLKAATAGSAEAMYQLGRAFLSGVDMVPKDEVEGRRWLAKAAEGGFPKAIADLRALVAAPK